MKFMFFVFCSSRPHSAIFLGRTEGSEEVVCPLHHSGGFHENKSGFTEMNSEMTGLFCLRPVRLPPCPCRVFWTAWFMPGGVQTSRRPCSGRTCRWRLTCPFLMNHYEATADRELLHVYCCAAIRVMSTKKTGAMAVQTGRFQWTEEERNKRMKDFFGLFNKNRTLQEVLLLLWISMESQEICQNHVDSNNLVDPEVLTNTNKKIDGLFCQIL